MKITFFDLLENGVEMLGKEAIVDSGIIIIICFEMTPNKIPGKKVMTPEILLGKINDPVYDTVCYCNFIIYLTLRLLLCYYN